jgi:hypothetical protein
MSTPLKTDWIRAAVEGKTADGREITKPQLEQIASSYDRNLYHAQIWLEHLRGLMPDSVFKALGSVAAVKAELLNEGTLAGKLALYVQLEPAPELVAMVRNGQKLHLSIEIHPDFPTTGGAYLMGIGVTDSPASLGTGIMQFSTAKHPHNLFSSPVACELGHCAEQDDLKAIRAMLEMLTVQKEPDFKGVPITPPQPEKFNQQHVAELEQQIKALQQEIKPFVELGKRFDAFMAESPDPKRPEQTGGRTTDTWNW